MKGNTKKLVFLISWFALAIGMYSLLLQGTFAHEKIHSFIYEAGGCENVTIDVSWDGTGNAKCEDFENYNETELMWSMHTMNEIVTYNFASMKQMLFLTNMILFAILFFLMRPAWT